MKTIKWGILGLGKIAHKFAEDLKLVENSELIAVASRSQQKADEFAEKYQVKKAYGSYLDLAKDSEADAVYIATPHSLHKVNSIQCLQHKKAVLCEKPFAMDLEEVQEMIAIAKDNNVLLMEALWTSFLPHFQYVLDLICHKKFGEILKLEADFGFYTPFRNENRVFKKELGGGSLLDIGIYPIFVALSTLGKPNNILANATFFENGADSSCSMIFEYDDVKAYLKSTLLEETKTEAVFTFEKAVLKINTRFHEPTTITILKNGKEEVVDFNYKSIGYNFEIQHFNELLRNCKKESDIMTFEFSEKLISTLDNVRKIINLSY